MRRGKLVFGTVLGLAAFQLKFMVFRVEQFYMKVGFSL